MAVTLDKLLDSQSLAPGLSDKDQKCIYLEEHHEA